MRGPAVTGDRRPRRLTGSEELRARELLADGACYAEVGRTLGRSYRTIQRYVPGYTLDRRQAAEVAALGRAMDALDRKSPIAVAAGNRATTKPEGKQHQ